MEGGIGIAETIPMSAKITEVLTSYRGEMVIKEYYQSANVGSSIRMSAMLNCGYV